MKKLLLVLVFAVLGTSLSIYSSDSLSASSKKKKTFSYHLKSVDVNLTLGHGAIPGDTTFSTEEELIEQFTNALNAALEEKEIRASSPSEASAEIEVVIDYQRNFNYGGKALNKPEISHTVSIYKGGKILTTLSESNYTTKYSYLKEISVNTQIAAFKWDAKDELKDVELISTTIVKDLYKVGKKKLR